MHARLARLGLGTILFVGILAVAGPARPTPPGPPPAVPALGPGFATTGERLDLSHPRSAPSVAKPTTVESPEPAPAEGSWPVSAAGEPLTPCADGLAWAADVGLRLPPGVGFRCPSTQFPHHGAACWNGSPCPRSAFVAVNLELIGTRGIDYVRHVVAHEICHILDFQATGSTTEDGAEACVATHRSGWFAASN